MDGDGSAEVLYSDELRFYVYRGSDGHELARLERGSGTTYEMPVVADIDGNGSAEIVVIANDYGGGNSTGIITLTSPGTPWSTTRSIWNQHTYHITNVNDDGTIPAVELNSWELYNNYRRNQQTTGTQIFPPTISASAPVATATIGTSVVLSGKAAANGKLANGSANRIVAVEVNGRAVDILDAEGNFFANVVIEAGADKFHFIATDAAGQIVSTDVTVIGSATSPTAIDFSRYADITDSFRGVYGRTSFQDDSNTLYVELATTNTGTFATDVPLLVGVKNLRERNTLQPTVEVLGADGITPDGIPYFNLSQFVKGATKRLGPGETTDSPAIAFSNPNRVRFDYDLVFYGKLNTPPLITSVPNVEALIGKPYSYAVTATDEDSDTISYRLVEKPSTAMAIDSATGIITWMPTATDKGNHTVVVEANDGRGGIATQRYTLSVIPAPPNRPPVITSIPVTMAILPHQTSRNAGRVVVDNDEWTLSDTGFSQSPDGAREFVQRVTEWFVGESRGRFLAYSNNFSLTGSALAAEMARLGHVWTVSTSLDFTSESLLEYDAVFLAGFAAPNDVLTDYVRRGGNIYLSGGTASLSGPANEAATWNNFLNELGLQFAPVFNGIGGVVPITDSPHPLLDDILLYQSSGNSIIDLDPSDNLGVIVANNGVDGLYAVYDGLTAANATFRYDVVATDPDNDILEYRIVAYPPGMWIDQVSGVIRWAPAGSQVGNHTVKVEVADGRGGVATQEFTVCVKPDPANHPPIFTSDPILTASLGSTYQYQASALDPDSDSLNFEKLAGPAALAIDSTTGLVTWNTTSQVAGPQDVTIRVRDSKGSFSDQPFTIDVKALGTGEIRGSVFNDLSSDGRRDGGIEIIGPNLVQNGSFENASNGINSDYLHTPQGNTDEGTWWVTPIDPGTAWGPPRSGTNVGRLNANGDDSSSAGTKRVWYQSVNVEAGKYYDFSAWAWSTHAAENGYQLRFAFDNTQIGPILSATETGLWESFNATYLATITGPVEISIINVSGRRFPNDFMLDDISLTEVFPPEPPLSSWTVYLDQNGNSRRDIGEISTLTDTNGNFAFTGLAPDTYIVREESQPGWRQTYPVAGENANLFINGDFEQFAIPAANWAPYPSLLQAAVAAGSSNLIGWTIVNGTHEVLGNIDYLGGPTTSVGGGLTAGWQAGSGARSLDLNGSAAAGGVSQTIVTQAGSVYRVRFLLSGNADDGHLFLSESPRKTMRVLIGDHSYDFTYDVSVEKNSYADMKWRGFTFDFIADSPSTTITFLSTMPGGSGGPALDDVSVYELASGTAHVIRLNDAEIATGIDFGNAQIAAGPNSNPSFASMPVATATFGNLYRYDAVATDPENDPLTYALIAGPAGMTLNPQTGTLVWQPQESQLGEHTVVLRVTDGHAGVAVQQFTLTVVAPNTAPVISSQPATQAVVGKPFVYDIAVQDADGDLITVTLLSGSVGTLAATPTMGPNNEPLQTRYRLEWTPSAAELAAGKGTIKLRAADGRGGSTEQIVEVTVVAAATNEPPHIHSEPRSVARPGILYGYAVLATDANADPLTFSLDPAKQPAGMTILPTGVITWTPPLTASGTYPVRILVSDGTAWWTKLSTSRSLRKPTTSRRKSRRIRRNRAA